MAWLGPAQRLSRGRGHLKAPLGLAVCSQQGSLTALPAGLQAPLAVPCLVGLSLSSLQRGNYFSQSKVSEQETRESNIEARSSSVT